MENNNNFNNINNNNKKVIDLIDVEFRYNGDLGKLQQKTTDNKIFCGRLYQNNIISHDEWRNCLNSIEFYFLQEIEKVIECPVYYTDIISG